MRQTDGVDRRFSTLPGETQKDKRNQNQRWMSIDSSSSSAQTIAQVRASLSVHIYVFYKASNSFYFKKEKSTKWWNPWKSYSFVMSTVVPQEDTNFSLIASISKVCLSNMDGFERWRQGNPPANNRETPCDYIYKHAQKAHQNKKYLKRSTFLMDDNLPH